MVKGRYARALVHGLMVVGLALPGSGGVARAEVTLFENLGSLHHRDHDHLRPRSKIFRSRAPAGLCLQSRGGDCGLHRGLPSRSRCAHALLGCGVEPGAEHQRGHGPQGGATCRGGGAEGHSASVAGHRQGARLRGSPCRSLLGQKSVTRKAKDEAYAKAMRQVAREAPDDADAATMAAEAMMVLRPWDYWRADGRPQPGTEEIVAILEAALRQHPDHPGACHYYIHAVEASPDPQRALDCAKRLPSLMPGAGHLVHMPAHIYMRLGRYREASERNATAAMVDHEYLSRHPLEGNYASGYYAHNLHFLNASLMMEGRSAEALQVARDLLVKVPADEIAKEPSLEWYAPTVLLTMARFGQWGDLIRHPPPSKSLRLTTGLWHFSRGLAFAATTRFGSAEGELSNLRKAMKPFARAKTAEGKISRTMLKVAERILVGEMAARRGQYEAGIQALREALQLEASLPYSEPPFWVQPVRHNLGAVLLLAERPVEAEAVYREDLRLNPENGWALHGLMQSLRAQNKDATQEETRFRAVWAQADVTLTGSRF
jgi:tetratricopeptide (TPR) repeat protein